MANGSGKAITDDAVKAALPGKFLWDGGKRGVAGLGLRVTAGGSRTWLYRYRNSEGRQRFLKIGRFPDYNTEAARKEATKKAGEVAGGTDPQAAKRAEAEAIRTAKTVADLAVYFEGEYTRAASLRPNTVTMNRGAIHNHILPQLGKLRVTQVTRANIRELHGKARQEGEAAGYKGVYQANRVLAVLHKMFALAVDDLELRAANPCEGVKRFEEDQRWRHLTEDEVGRLLAACDDYEDGRRLKPADKEGAPSRLSAALPESMRSATDREAANAIRLLLYTGARLREVLKAEWSQFDLDAGLWEKPSAHTKTRRQHRLELAGPALRLVEIMAEKKGHPTYLFPGNPKLRRNNAPVDILTGQPKGITPRHDLRRPWRAICAMAGIEGVQLHDLRRTTASFMLSGGASLATVGKALGHTQPSTTARYATLEASVQREGLKAAGERMAAAKGKRPPKRPPGDVLAFPATGKNA
jgi:integrase